MGIGFREILVILVIVLLVFGTKKLKTMGADLGGAVKGFKKAMRKSRPLRRPSSCRGPPARTPSSRKPGLVIAAARRAARPDTTHRGADAKRTPGTSLCLISAFRRSS
jgi:sec-independent protein translocase protein TatA